MMAARGVHAVPTLTTYTYIFDRSGGYYDSTSRRFSFSKEANLDVLRRMKQAGIKMGIGTDLVMDAFRFLPNAYITELEWFVKGGYTKPEVLVAATRTGAEILGMDDKLGTLTPGKLADVLVVEGRPRREPPGPGEREPRHPGWLYRRRRGTRVHSPSRPRARADAAGEFSLKLCLFARRGNSQAVGPGGGGELPFRRRKKEPTMKLLSVNVSLPREITVKGMTGRTGI